MNIRKSSVLLLTLIFVCTASIVTSARPIYTTHFFDWYHVNQQRTFSSYQRQWTYHPEWERYGIQSDEIGETEPYYAIQMRMIHQAGFDGIHYEWYGVQPSNEFISAIKATHMKTAMFYDMEIRHGGTANYIQPTDTFRDFVIHDIVSFYDRIPRNLWLRETDGALPIIFYAYQFDTAFNDISQWDHFYKTLLSGLQSQLNAPVHIYWTSTNALPQIYAFQHFPQISSYTFGWWGNQIQIGAKSVTLIAAYDDAGAVVGGRAARTINDDPRYLETDLRLAEVGNPELVFNYGWNEFYEGEHIFPDSTWGDWRYRVMSAIVKRLKADKNLNPLPKAVLIADDLYPDSQKRPNTWYDAEINLLNYYRYLFPQADEILPAQASEPLLKSANIVIVTALNITQSLQQRLIRIANHKKTHVLFFAPDTTQSNLLTRLFTTGKRIQPFAKYPPPPGNQWVGAVQKVEVDPNKYPFIHIQVRNSLDTFYMVRFQGVDAEGNIYENHDNGSPLDWQVTGDKWTERTANAKEILEAYAHKPIVRITGITVILNATGVPGNFQGDFADASFTDANGNVGSRVNFDSAKLWEYRSSFQNGPNFTWPKGSLKVLPEQGGILRLSMNARYSQSPMDTCSQIFPLLPEAKALSWTTWAKSRVPLVLQRGDIFWVNSASPALSVYRRLMAKLGMPAPYEPEFKMFTEVKGVAARSVTVNPAPTIILHPAELPINWIRMVHPPHFPMNVSYPFPITTKPLAEILVKSGKPVSIPVLNRSNSKDKVNAQGSVSLSENEVADIYRLPIAVKPLGKTGVVTIKVTHYAANGALLYLSGHGVCEVKTTAPGLRLLERERPAPNRVRLPCELRLNGKLEWHSK